MEQNTQATTATSSNEVDPQEVIDLLKDLCYFNDTGDNTAPEVVAFDAQLKEWTTDLSAVEALRTRFGQIFKNFSNEIQVLERFESEQTVKTLCEEIIALVGNINTIFDEDTARLGTKCRNIAIYADTQRDRGDFRAGAHQLMLAHDDTTASLAMSTDIDAMSAKITALKTVLRALEAKTVTSSQPDSAAATTG